MAALGRPDDFYSAIIDFQGVVEGDFIFGEAEILGFAQLFGQFNKFGNNLCGFNAAVLITADGVLQMSSACWRTRAVADSCLSGG